MARKAVIISLALALALAGAAFAGGQKEPSQQAGPQNAPGAPAAPGAQTAPGQPAAEKIVLTGAVTITNRMRPELASGGKVYELLVPRRLAARAGVKDGDTITIEGYAAAGRLRGAAAASGETAVFVTKATINGKEYDLSRLRGRGWGPGMRGGNGARGPRWGMMGGGSGPRGGMMGGGGPQGGDRDDFGCWGNGGQAFGGQDGDGPGLL